MGSGVGLYDPETPLDMQRLATAANDEQVFVELRIRARTGAGEAYDNQYVFVFTLQNGQIAEVHEHLDTLYAQRRLFDPIGQQSPLG
jgi:ketosteroid isomerase-like protein